MSIGVQTTNAALLALQTLGQLNNPAATDETGAATASTASSSSPILTDAVTSSLSVGNLGAASASLDRASSITDAALSAGQSIGDLLNQMKSLASDVESGSVSGDAANSDYSALLGQISAAVSSAGFDGVNLLDGSSSPAVTVGAGAGAVTLSAPNLSLGGGVITLGATSTLSTASAAADVLGNVDASLTNLAQALGQIGDQSAQVSAHASFVARLSSVLSSGGSASVPASADSAKLMALQVQQQLSLGGSIASAAPNVVLSLFQ